MSKSKPDRLRRLVEQYQSQTMARTCQCLECQKYYLQKLLRREQARTRRIANKCAVGNCINKVDFLAALKGTQP